MGEDRKSQFRPLGNKAFRGRFRAEVDGSESPCQLCGESTPQKMWINDAYRAACGTWARKKAG